MAPDSTSPKSEVMYPYASGSGSGNRTLDILFEARSRRAAVGAFTVYSMESIRAVVEAAQATGRSAILQVGNLCSCCLSVFPLSGTLLLLPSDLCAEVIVASVGAIFHFFCCEESPTCCFLPQGFWFVSGEHTRQGRHRCGRR